jgi:16S rRNA processing protein RimM
LEKSLEPVVIARLTRPRGIKGELCGIALTDHPERYQSLTVVQIAGTSYDVERVWYHKNQPIFKFRGIDSINSAEPLGGHDVCVPASERFVLSDEEHYFADLVGCRVVDARSGVPIGVVTGWEELGGPVVLELDDGRVLVPYAKAILPEIDLQAREIRANLPDGLLELNR